MTSGKNSVNQVITLLKNYFRKDYLFHGSSSPNIKILEPRKATDTENRPFNTDTAVFAAENPASAIIFAVMPPKGTRGMASGTWSVDFKKEKEPPIAKIPYQWKKLLTGRSGYVYVLPKTTFIGEGGQYKSLTSVTPVDKIKVAFGNFEAMGGVLNWEK